MTAVPCCCPVDEETSSVRLLAMPDNLGYAQGLVPPPPGVTPNFVNPPWNGIHLVVASIVCPVLAAVFVAARCASKTLSHGWGWDDCQYSPRRGSPRRPLMDPPADDQLLCRPDCSITGLVCLRPFEVPNARGAERLLMGPDMVRRLNGGQYHP